MSREPKKGRYTPLYPKKYKGNPTQIIYRSGLELSCMKYFDMHPDVIEWSSEEVIVPYRCKTDGRLHRYFPDFVIKVRNKNGSIRTVMIEVKPHTQTVEPKKKKKMTRTYITEVMTWAKNVSKWDAAREYCADRKWEFKILTEKDIRGQRI